VDNRCIRTNYDVIINCNWPSNHGTCVYRNIITYARNFLYQTIGKDFTFLIITTYRYILIYLYIFTKNGTVGNDNTARMRHYKSFAYFNRSADFNMIFTS